MRLLQSFGHGHPLVQEREGSHDHSVQQVQLAVSELVDSRDERRPGAQEDFPLLKANQPPQPSASARLQSSTPHQHHNDKDLAATSRKKVENRVLNVWTDDRCSRQRARVQQVWKADPCSVSQPTARRANCLAVQVGMHRL